MDLAFEITIDDVRTVLMEHKYPYTEAELEDLFQGLDCDELETDALRYTNSDDQTNSVLHGIEQHLIDNRTLEAGTERFEAP